MTTRKKPTSRSETNKRSGVTGKARKIPIWEWVWTEMATKGLSVVSIRPDGTKAAAVPWAPYEVAIPTLEQVREMWRDDERGIAIINGKVSGNLVTFDFERWTDFEFWWEVVGKIDPRLANSLTVSETPGHVRARGAHVRCRLECDPPRSMKIADFYERDEEGGRVKDSKGRFKTKCLIELRGEGSYAIAPGSNPKCHPGNRCWSYKWGPRLKEIKTISADNFDLLVDLARSLGDVHQEAAPPQKQKADAKYRDGLSPMDDYDLRGPDPDPNLEGKGWKLLATVNGVQFWQRPDKKGRGISATFGYCKGSKGEPLFHCFSTNALPFEAGKSYGKSRVLAWLYHGKNYSKTAQDLISQGYGSPGPGRNAQQRSRAAAGAAIPAAVSGDGASLEVIGEASSWDQPVPLNKPPAVDTFPVDVFPDGLRGFVEEVAVSKNCPPDFVAVPMLAVAAGCIGNSSRIYIKKEWDQSAMLWACLIGGPGSGKSPALDTVLVPVRYDEVRRKRQHEAKLAEWKKQGKPEGGEPPIWSRFVVGDATTEALSPLLAENLRGLLTVRDEMSGFWASMNQYKSGGGHDRQWFLEVWTGRLSPKDRKGDRANPIMIERAFLGLIGGVQPDVLSSFFGGAGKGSSPAVADGFQDRFLFSWPDELPAVGERWLEISDVAQEAWSLTVKDLLELQGTFSDGVEQPRVYKLTPGAKDAWQHFTEAIAKQENSPDCVPAMKGVLSKLRVYGSRLALVVHLLRTVCKKAEGDVDEESIRLAAKLVDYFASHARKANALMAPQRAVAEATKVLEWLRGNDRTEFKQYDVFRDRQSKSFFPTIESLSRPIALIEDHGFIREKPADDIWKTGRPRKPTYQVNPLWDRENRENRENSPDGLL